MADSGVSATGRRHLREPIDGVERGGGPQHWETGTGRPGGPGAPVADTGVSASGRRRLREPLDDAGRGVPPQPPETGPGGLNGSGAPEGRRRSGDPGAGPGAPAADSGVSASGRRRLREPMDDAGRGAGPRTWEAGPGALNGSGAPGSGGRRRLRDPLDEPGHAGGAAPWGVDTGPGAGWPADPERADGSRPGRTEQPGGGGRRDLHEPPAPWDTGADGSGGRRRRREPEPTPPARNGSTTDPWSFGPGGPADPEPAGGPRDHRRGRRALGRESLIDTGEQDAGWAEALDAYAEQRGGGRHSGAESGDVSPPTVRLQALLADLDPNRPRRRHRREA